MYRFICILLAAFLLNFASLHGQGWERLYPGKGQDIANAVALAPDGGVVMTGYYDLGQLYVLKTDANGLKQWSFTYLTDTRAEGRCITATRDGGFVIAGYSVVRGGNDAIILKVNASGKQVWMRNLGLPTTDDEARAIVELADGSLVIAGYQGDRSSTPGIDQDMRIVKTSANGTVLWTKNIGTPTADESAASLAVMSNGDIALAGESVEVPLTTSLVARLKSDNGDVVWSRNYAFPGNSTTFPHALTTDTRGRLIIAGNTSSTTMTSGALLMCIEGTGAATPVWTKIYPRSEFYGITSDRRGGFYITGSKNNTPVQSDLYIVRADRDGDILWETTAGRGVTEIGYGIVTMPDGGAASAGYSQPFSLSAEELPYLVKTDADGGVFTSYLSGKIFYDRNNNCRLEAGEPALEDWIARIEGENFTLYAAADSRGNFTIPVDTGTYKISLYNSNDYWKPCEETFQVRIRDFYSNGAVQLPVQARYSCPRNEVNIAAPVLRRCSDNTYVVRYCNSGTAPSVNTRIEVDLDPGLEYKSSTATLTAREGNKLTFNVGTLAAGDCGSFSIRSFLSCSAVVNGAHCTEAHIFPDSICSVASAWDGSILRAVARCKGDTVQFLAKNVGRATQTRAASYIVIEDLIVVRAASGSVGNEFKDLKPNEEKLLWSKEGDGSTYRIVMDQSPGYPGSSRPTAAIEGCATRNSTIETGFLTMFPEDDGDLFLSKDCQENYAANFNPSMLKRGHPKGYDVNHYINPQTGLEYMIRFTNNTNDTVRQVIIRDTLSSALDPASARPGVGSHPFDFEVYGGGITQFLMNNVRLAPGEEGFVKFSVNQRANLARGTRIPNKAAVYLDFNAPVYTNPVFHTVDKDENYLLLSSDAIQYPGAKVSIAPNPFRDEANFDISGVKAKQYRLEVYDIQGKLLFNQHYSHSTFRLFRHNLPSGAFFYRLTADGKPVASGKIIAE
jgi:PQQ-like domain